MDIRRLVEENKEAMVNWRHTIHTNPELGFKEFETTQLVERELSSAGIELRPLEAETGVLGILKGGLGDGPVILLRADMDALPMDEDTGVRWSSQNPGVMHACGHDGHTSVLLGAAKTLAALKDRLRGEIRFLFQPAEETLYGARKMIEAGVLENPPADYVMGLHGSPLAEVGQVAVLRGPVMASADMFTVTFSADGGHGAYPHRTRDPIVAAGHFITSVQEIVSRQVNTLDSAVVSVCAVEAGTAYNIIPKNAVLKGTIRTLREEVRGEMEERLREKVEGVAKTFGCQWNLDFIHGIPSVSNDDAMVDRLYRAAGTVLGSENVVDPVRPLMGSEDFAFYGEIVPQSLFFQLGFVEPGEPIIHLHNSKFDFNDKALVPGASVFCQFVWDLLGNGQ